MTTALLLLSAAMHALWNALAKWKGDPRANLMGMLFVALLCGPLGLPFFGQPPYFSTWNSFLWTLVAGAAEAAYLVTLAKALQSTGLGSAYTIMRGAAMLFVWAGSTALLGESLDAKAGSGALLVLAGLLAANTDPLRRIFLGSNRWAFACALFIAIYHLCYRAAAADVANPAALNSLALWISVPFFLWVSGRRRRREARAVLFTWPVLVGGVICSLSFLIFLVALRDVGAGASITLRNTSVVFAQVFALAIGEKVALRQWVGALLVVLGAVLLG